MVRTTVVSSSAYSWWICMMVFKSSQPSAGSVPPLVMLFLLKASSSYVLCIDGRVLNSNYHQSIYTDNQIAVTTESTWFSYSIEYNWNCQGGRSTIQDMAQRHRNEQAYIRGFFTWTWATDYLYVQASYKICHDFGSVFTREQPYLSFSQCGGSVW